MLRFDCSGHWTRFDGHIANIDIGILLCGVGLLTPRMNGSIMCVHVRNVIPKIGVSKNIRYILF